VRRFEAEAAAVAQLRHPNIIQVYDFNHDGDTYYMVLEYVPGETLHTRLGRLASEHRRLPIEELVSIGADVAGAIDYAHQRGLIHRDIKPANVMINPDGHAVLMDFGIAKIMGSAAQTATGTVVGTAQYISPEQVRGQRPNERSDIYSLGVTLFEMAAGQPPFDGDSAMTIMLKHVNEPVPDLRSLSPGISPDLVAVIERTLSKDPEQRYASAGELARALRLVGSHPATPPAQATIIEKAPPGGATVLEPAAAPRPSAPATVSPTLKPAPPAQPSAQTPPAAAAPAFTGQQPAPPQPAAGAGQRGRSVSTGLLIGVPLALIVCIGLVVIAALAAQTLGSPDPTATVAPTAAPTSAPATAAPTDVIVPPTDTPPAEPTLDPVRAGMVLIPAGSFPMGSDAFDADQQPVHHVTLEAFYLDPYEVTNARYELCVKEGACNPPAKPGSFTRAAYFGVAEFADHPVVAVTWSDAANFCAWDGGKRLPTEAEWEYAATGGDGRHFPWGFEFDGSLLPSASNDTLRVGSFPGGVSPLGAYDMAGNALEWVADYYDPLYYVESEEANPTGPEFGDERVLRGGSFGNPDGLFYVVSRRYHLNPDLTEVDIGFRCALAE
jgi:serine/threonine-protein kinase